MRTLWCQRPEFIQHNKRTQKERKRRKAGQMVSVRWFC